MGGKRSAQPPGSAEGRAAGSGEKGEESGLSRKRQTQGLGVHGPAWSAEAEQEESGSILARVTMGLSWQCDPSALAGRKVMEEAVEAALRSVISEFGGRGVKVQWTRVGPSEDTLHGVLPLVLERVGQEGARCFHVCKAWRRELEARGFCNTTFQLCSAFAKGGDAEWLQTIAHQRLHASAGVEREFWSDTNAFLMRNKWPVRSSSTLHEWLQAASQEPDESFVSRGGASTAQVLYEKDFN